MKIIGVSGYARAGKDSIAAILVEKYGYTRTAFADKMRECALALDPIVDSSDFAGPIRLSVLVDEIGWDEAKVEYPEIRRTLQRLGTEVGRNILGEDVWVDTTMRALEYDKKYVIADVRFPNEFHAIREAGGEVWRVERDGCGPANDHPSETSLDGWEFDNTILNSGTLDHLASCVDFALMVSA